MTGSGDLHATGATTELMANFDRIARALFLTGGVEAALRAVVKIAVATTPSSFPGTA
jgi:hypothetical protein